jgi:hypothetical protein
MKDIRLPGIQTTAIIPIACAAAKFYAIGHRPRRLPGHNPQTVTAVNAKTKDPTTVTRADSATVTSTENPLGQQDTQSGGGQLPARFGYDVSGTGNLTSLKTFQSNTLDGTGAATTAWNYDQATGQLYQKTWAMVRRTCTRTMGSAPPLRYQVLPNRGRIPQPAPTSTLTDGITGQSRY